MSAEKTRQCDECGKGMELRKGPFKINISGSARKLTGNVYHCENCGNTVPDEDLTVSVMNTEDW